MLILNSLLIWQFWQEETQAESESDDEEQQIYNPLKLPMGWDGKPIPYWLYKLHGLGQVNHSLTNQNPVAWQRKYSIAANHHELF